MQQREVLDAEADVVLLGGRDIERAGVLALVVQAQRREDVIVAAKIQSWNRARIRVEQRDSLRAQPRARNDVAGEVAAQRVADRAHAAEELVGSEQLAEIAAQHRIGRRLELLQFFAPETCEL